MEFIFEMIISSKAVKNTFFQTRLSVAINPLIKPLQVLWAKACAYTFLP